jgi:hypothetical protein
MGGGRGGRRSWDICIRSSLSSEATAVFCELPVCGRLDVMAIALQVAVELRICHLSNCSGLLMVS